MPPFQMAPNLAHNLTKNSAIFNAVFAAYIEAIYFTDTEFDSEDQPSPDCEMAIETQFNAMSDCADFLSLCAKDGLIEEYADSGATWEQFGHDFWLTRNGHGAGFWDRGLGALGDKLSKAAKSMGGRDIYSDDTGLIYFG
jgi:hypothetical protein